jgi:hypothetical protein
MARFYATFEHNLQFPTLQENASTKAFLKRNIGATSQQGLDLQAGLITSRSLLSDAIYATLDSINIDGSRGTYFPPDLITTDLITFVSGTVYTSSVDGIKTPITNTYDVGQAINYSKRPTSSITSSQTTLVGLSDPVDIGSTAYSLYKNATDAVTSVLTSIQGGGPYNRLGQIPSRTLHSIWNDPDLNYFAWDDFTPGTGSISVGISPVIGTGQVTYVTASTTVDLSFAWLTEYPSDLLGNATIFATLLGPTNNTLATLSPTSTAASSGYLWNIAASAFNTMTGSSGQLATVDATIAFSDVTIPTNNGAAQQTVNSNFATIQRMITLTSRVSSSVAANGTCRGVTIPLYVAWDPNGPGIYPADPNPIGNNTFFFPTVFRALIDNNDQPVPYIPTENPDYSGGNYFLIQTDNGTAGGNEIICEYNSSGVQLQCFTDPNQNTCGNQPLCGQSCTTGGEGGNDPQPGQCPPGCSCTLGTCQPTGAFE